MSNLIGISGRISSGKDTVGKIIQLLTDYPKMSTERIIQQLDKPLDKNTYQIKKFADALKDCVCIIIGCTREQLEDQDFKNRPLGSEWGGFYNGEETQLTPRLLLQLLGTDAGRNIIHPNIWCNASFAKYKFSIGYAPGDYYCRCNICGKHFEGDKRSVRCEEHSIFYPNWIFTDMRFPNELQAIKDRGGITIRVERAGGKYIGDEHESETALDSAEFDYIIQNNGSLSNLVGKVQAILELEKII